MESRRCMGDAGVRIWRVGIRPLQELQMAVSAKQPSNTGRHSRSRAVGETPAALQLVAQGQIAGWRTVNTRTISSRADSQCVF